MGGVGMEDGTARMEGYRRYAIYAAPEGALGDFGAAWLGWDAVHGVDPAAPDVGPLPRPREGIVATPRKYGFHGTIKPPFRLAEGVAASDLYWAVQSMCLGLAPVATEGLALTRIGGFLALVPVGDTGPLGALAARVVEALDPFRAPPDAAEIARRNPDRLTPRQRELLDRWGYPYVMEEFRFHLTLTGDLPGDEAQAVQAALAPVVDRVIPRPFVLDSLALFGEVPDGRFRLIQRYPLGS
jgi:putative phosphonate metabolism protein